LDSCIYSCGNSDFNDRGPLKLNLEVIAKVWLRNFSPVSLCFLRAEKYLILSFYFLHKINLFLKPKIKISSAREINAQEPEESLRKSQIYSFYIFCVKNNVELSL
jgi:hypothetical protein